MKLTSTPVLAFTCLSTLFFSCSKETNLKAPATTPAVEQNVSLIHNTLQTTDLSAKKPGDWWWNDETLTASSAASSVRGITVPIDPKNLISFKYLDAALAYTGLDAVLADPGFEYTVFAPNDQAF